MSGPQACVYGDREVCIAGGEIASTFDKPESVKLGSCKLIEEIMIGEDKLIHFSGVEMGEACTIILRGASKSSASCFHIKQEEHLVPCNSPY